MRPTATWYAVAGPNGDLTWRVESPAHVIGAKVQYIPEDVGAETLFYPNDEEFFPWHMNIRLEGKGEIVVKDRASWDALAEGRARVLDIEAVYPQHEGAAAVWTRPLAWPAVHMLQMRHKHGIRVVAEVDDNYLSHQRKNIFMQTKGWDLEARDNHARSICSADAIIVSTEYLRDMYWRTLTREWSKKHIPPIYVCRNHVDRRFVPAETVPPRADGRLRIGYMGSDSHIWDISLIYDALMEAQELGHEIVFIGIHPAMLNPKYLRDKRQDWTKLRYTHVPWVNEGYRGTPLPLDIGFAPLVVNDHTLGKSDIKWMEYALSGAATIAQNCLVYNRTAKHGETALMANGPDEFRRMLRALIRDEGLRNALVRNTLQYIEEERMIENHADEWREAVLG